ncbi:MAG: hypothetical protein JW902_07385 [Syntrophaceae bacterium]|nr:hypothetical protein [Syntrophaceae bacterium]
MKSVSIIFIDSLLVLLLSGICIADDSTFRKSKWGMSIAEVKASEPLEVAKEDENFLAYKTSVIGKDVFVAYFFVDNQLTRARYVLADSHSNKNDFIIDYEDFKKILIKKYGNPVQDESIWRNDLYKDDYSDWGTAISIGHLIYFSNWKTKDTGISILLSGENYDISCIIEYSSTNFKETEKKAQEKKALEAF